MCTIDARHTKENIIMTPKFEKIFFHDIKKYYFYFVFSIFIVSHLMRDLIIKLVRILLLLIIIRSTKYFINYYHHNKYFFIP